MTDERALLGAEPQLFVSDLDVACAFYTRRLGFSLAFTHGDPPFYAQVVRDRARLNLRHLDEPAIDVTLRDSEQLLSATITLADAAPLFREYEAASVSFAQTLQNAPWGAQMFIVRDPDGNLILFAGAGP